MNSYSSLDWYDRAMQRLADQHEPFKVNLPEAVSGDWRVRRFEVKADLEAMRCWRDGRPVPPGMFTRLEGPNGLFMTDTPAELNDAEKLLRCAEGHVLISGLGLGMIPRALLMDRVFGPSPVNQITIVELEQDVINLVAPYLDDPRITVVQGNAFDLEFPTGTKFDWAWHDIWPDMAPEYVPQFSQLRRHFGRYMRRGGRQLVWAEKHHRTGEY